MESTRFDKWLYKKIDCLTVVTVYKVLDDSSFKTLKLKFFNA